jgi:hypothetical protein
MFYNEGKSCDGKYGPMDQSEPKKLPALQPAILVPGRTQHFVASNDPFEIIRLVRNWLHKFGIDFKTCAESLEITIVYWKDGHHSQCIFSACQEGVFVWHPLCDSSEYQASKDLWAQLLSALGPSVVSSDKIPEFLHWVPPKISFDLDDLKQTDDSWSTIDAMLRDDSWNTQCDALCLALKNIDVSIALIKPDIVAKLGDYLLEEYDTDGCLELLMRYRACLLLYQLVQKWPDFVGFIDICASVARILTTLNSIYNMEIKRICFGIFVLLTDANQELRSKWGRNRAIPNFGKYIANMA